MDTAKLVEEANKTITDRQFRVTVLYGDFGKRKTTTACRMVNKRGLLISADGSWRTLLNDRHKEEFDKVTIIPYEGLSQLDHVDFDGYDTAIWDTFSHSVDIFLDLLYDKASWGGKYRDKISTSDPEIKGLEILAPTDYRVVRDKFRPTLNRLLKLPLHWVFTSQVNEPVKGLSLSMTLKPAIPGSTFKMLARQADIIAYIRPNAGKFEVCMQDDTLTYIGRSRIQGIQGIMDIDSFVTKYKENVF